MKNKIKHENIQIVLANQSNSKDLFNLRNDEDVRKNSFYSAEINYNDHNLWLKNKLLDENCLFLIAKYNDKFIGQIRFDFTDNTALINISLHKNFRGYGIGEFLINEGLKELKKRYIKIKKIEAFIKENNTSSIKLFKKCGFCYSSEELNNNYKILKYTLTLYNLK